MKVFQVGAESDLQIDAEATGLPNEGALWVIRKGAAGLRDQLPIVAIYNHEHGVRQFLKWCCDPWHGLETLVFLAFVTVERVNYNTEDGAKGIITNFAKDFMTH